MSIFSATAIFVRERRWPQPGWPVRGLWCASAGISIFNLWQFCTVLSSHVLVMCCVQSYLHMSQNSLMSESLGLDLSGTTRSAAALSTGRGENVNYMLDLSDDEVDVISSLFLVKDAA